MLKEAGARSVAAGVGLDENWSATGFAAGSGKGEKDTVDGDVSSKNSQSDRGENRQEKHEHFE
jgi:hypothetical protein